MLNTGIVSVTFRKLSVEEVAKVTKNAGLSTIEWGGDIHVPPMNEEAIADAKKATAENGLTIASYGSYFNCTGDDEEMEKNLKTASLLGAPNIRIWAGKLWSNDYTDETRAEFVKRIKHTVQSAAKYGLTVSPEFHGGTLTDELDSALRLVDEIGEDNFRRIGRRPEHETLRLKRHLGFRKLPLFERPLAHEMQGVDRLRALHLRPELPLLRELAGLEDVISVGRAELERVEPSLHESGDRA